MKSQSTESVEVPLEKYSDDKGSGTEKIPLSRREREGEDPEATGVKFEFGTDENGNEDMDEFISSAQSDSAHCDEFIEVFIETMPDLGPTLGMETLLRTETMRDDADIMSYATNNKSKTAAEEELLDKAECRKESMLAEKCVLGDAESVNVFDISESIVLPSVANESTNVNVSLNPLNTAAKETTDIDVSAGPLQNNNNTNNNRFLNVVSLPDGSFEIVLDNGAWTSEGPDQERYLDIEFPVLDEQDFL